MSIAGGPGEVRDPLHGPITLSPAEQEVVDSAAFQRLRRISQLGFGEATFPGATHSRYLHSLGTMHLAGMAFDAVAGGLDGLEEKDRLRLRSVLRLAALLHDVGHPPLSHQLEHRLPPVDLLGLPESLTRLPAGTTRRATHEDMSLMLILQSELSSTITRAFGPLGISPGHIATVLRGQLHGCAEEDFEISSRSVLPLMRKLVSGELDCDRMDYLRRDAYFAGVPYGRFDQDWILSNLRAVPGEGVWELGLDARALFTFEDFLLSRYHMFMLVYAHQRTLAYDRMLRAFFQSGGVLEYLPPAAAEYLEVDDSFVFALLKEHGDRPWADRLLRRRPPPLALEVDEDRDDVKPAEIRAALERAEIPYLAASVHLPLSHYVKDTTHQGGDEPPLFIVSSERALHPGVRPVADTTDLYDRYRHTPRLFRFYVDEEHMAALRGLDLSGAGR